MAADQYLDRRKAVPPPPYRPPPAEPGPPINRRNSHAGPASNGSGAYSPPVGQERPARLDLVPADLGLPPAPPRRPDGEFVPPPVPRRQLPAAPTNYGPAEPLSLVPASLSKSYGNLSVDENKENRLEGSQSVDNLAQGAAEKISVRERTKTFNRMASETDMAALTGSTSKLTMVKRRNSRAVEIGGNRRASRDDDNQDAASITTLDPSIKSWMVQISKGQIYLCIY